MATLEELIGRADELGLSDDEKKKVEVNYNDPKVKVAGVSSGPGDKKDEKIVPKIEKPILSRIFSLFGDDPSVAEYIDYINPETDENIAGRRDLPEFSKPKIPENIKKPYDEGMEKFLDWHENPETKKRVKKFLKGSGISMEFYNKSIRRAKGAKVSDRDKYTGIQKEIYASENTAATYSSRSHEINISEKSTPNTVKHELTHAAGFDALFGLETLRLLGEPVGGENEYLMSPTEVYPNLTHIRGILNKSPGETITVKELEKLKMDNEKTIEDGGSIPYASEMLDIWSLKNIANTLNTIAFQKNDFLDSKEKSLKKRMKERGFDVKDINIATSNLQSRYA